MLRTNIAKKIFHSMEYAGIMCLYAVLGVLPIKYIYMFAKFLGMCSFYCLRIRRNATMANLRRALGNELNEADLKKIARDAYINIGMTFVEMLFIFNMKTRIADMVDMSDIIYIKKHLELKRGLIFVSCHFGSWELNGAALAAYGIPITVVAKRQSNPYIDRFISKSRTEFGMKVIPHGAPVKHIVRALRNHEAVGLISDQDAGKKGIFINFFGSKASTPQGAAQLAMKYDVPIVVVVTVRIRPGYNKSIFKEIDVRNDDTVEILTQRYTKIMEDIIRRHPEQYFWMHRRWKTSPPEKDFPHEKNESYGTSQGIVA
ncbi:lysophospholipid acyltransferase family protein [Candidatus Latescibacterota bacterium]